MENKCEHKFVHLDTKKTYDATGWQTHFRRIDMFFCEKCLEYKDKIREDYSRTTPDWYGG